MAKKKRRRNRQLQVRLYHGWLDDYLPFIHSLAELKVYLCIATYCDWQTGEGCPTFSTIQADTGLCKDSVRDAIRLLKEKGMLSYEFRKAINSEGNEYGRKRYFYKIAHKPQRRYFRNDNHVTKGALKRLFNRGEDVLP